jgi:hypothetical protein
MQTQSCTLICALVNMFVQLCTDVRSCVLCTMFCNILKSCEHLRTVVQSFAQLCTVVCK